MSVYRFKRGWKAEVWIDQKRVESRSGFATKGEAERWHDSMAVRYRTNPAPMEKPDYTFENLVQRFEEIHLPTICEGTRLRYKLDIGKRIHPSFRYMSLKAIDRLQIEQFRSDILKTLSPKSVNNCMDLLKLMFRKSVEWEMLEKNPATFRTLKLPAVKYVWWEKKEHVARFLAEARKTPLYAAYKLALECGLRLGEIVGLSKQDVDLKRHQLHIHRQWLEAQGCFGPTKGRRERFINFSPDSGLKEALAEAFLRSPDREAIFVTKTGRRIRSTKLRKHFPMLIRRSKVPHLKFHELRHTFASWYMIEHDDIWSLKQILGHKDIQTTQRYAHLSTKHQTVGALNWGEEKISSRSIHAPNAEDIKKPLEFSRG